MNHAAQESQACQRKAIAHGRLTGHESAYTEQMSIDLGYCLDAPDLLTGETLFSRDFGGGSFQWTIDR